MTPFSYTCMVWISFCVGLVSAEVEIPISGHVGSTVILPCNLLTADTEPPHIRWNTEFETVFERRGEAFDQGSGYEGRVDVPEDELRKGNCSLVLNNLTLTDAGVYTSYQRVRRTMRSVETKLDLISSVKLSVDDKPLLIDKPLRAETPAPTGDAGMMRPHLLILALSLMLTPLLLLEQT